MAWIVIGLVSGSMVLWKEPVTPSKASILWHKKLTSCLESISRCRKKKELIVYGGNSASHYFRRRVEPCWQRRTVSWPRQVSLAWRTTTDPELTPGYRHGDAKWAMSHIPLQLLDVSIICTGQSAPRLVKGQFRKKTQQSWDRKAYSLIVKTQSIEKTSKNSYEKYW